MDTPANTPLLNVEGLSKYYPIKAGIFKRRIGEVRALDGVSFTIQAGQSLGIVGESGCGKSTLGKTLLKLQPPTGGSIRFKNQDITHYTRQQMRPLRQQLQIIFQDPFYSLNPRHSVQKLLLEPLEIHKLGESKDERLHLIQETLQVCGLRANILNRYPHEFSGGQRQRIGIARALLLRPELIVADEPVSALDVSIQSQILNLLKKLQKEFSLTYAFISHDLAVIEYVSTHIAVMYLGRIIEYAETQELFTQPKHPYTQALISAIPIPDPEAVGKRVVLQGEVPSPSNPPAGCHFHPRCPIAADKCRREAPETRDLGKSAKHLVSCHFAE